MRCCTLDILAVRWNLFTLRQGSRCWSPRPQRFNRRHLMESNTGSRSCVLFCRSNNQAVGLASHAAQALDVLRRSWLWCECHELEQYIQVLAGLWRWQRRIQNLGPPHACKCLEQAEVKECWSRFNHTYQMAHWSYHFSLVRTKRGIRLGCDFCWQQDDIMGLLRRSGWVWKSRRRDGKTRRPPRSISWKRWGFRRICCAGIRTEETPKGKDIAKHQVNC